MIDKDKLYPLLFEPIYKKVMWGGKSMGPVLGRKMPKTKQPIGESWDISDRDEDNSIVSNGPLAGASINELVSHYGKNLVGRNFRGGRFPLLVKIIDAGLRLSLQVHPDDAACKRIGGGAEPKTEMWYIINAKPGAKIIAGLKAHSTQRQFMANLNSEDIENCLQVFDSVSGDAYFINSGRIHAIGAGNLLLEIQQNSNTTYRVSDWGRVSPDGTPRELHMDQALNSIDFTDRTVCRIAGVSDSMEHNRKFPMINKCPYFRVDDLRLVESWRDSTDSSSSFHLITAIKSPVVVGLGELTTLVPKGSTCLIPACFGKYTITLQDEQETTVIKTTL
ncbi:MAG: hypothetical protein A2X49_07735 [Lentisphaerae bacterium GWF2_52_8]|nr:MAG: hypothetical protein A2X49_07735 [Lentisphaerae bacterium GWF2_52_8]